ncbi:MAG: twin-arginine translocation pathway signal, partial [Proteobacteria bacterium]|nr:twin-arginine translocation pathway signal [Pseudomonadota bacterium]
MSERFLSGRFARRSVAALGLALLFAVPVASLARVAVPASTKQIAVEAKAIPAFQNSSGSRKTFGKLEFRGGLQLTSSEPTFGGWSGITIEPDGRRFMAISDEGAWLAGEITYDGIRPTGIAKA